MRRVVKNCIAWKKKTNSRVKIQCMAGLPASRLQLHESPFSHVGVDYFGALIANVKRSQAKRYGCLFTCMTTRAIHLELAINLSSFITVLRRFSGGREPVKHIYFDNGSNFVGAEHDLKDSLLKNQDTDIPNFLGQKEQLGFSKHR